VTSTLLLSSRQDRMILRSHPILDLIRWYRKHQRTWPHGRGDHREGAGAHDSPSFLPVGAGTRLV
jgi:hypothetical protein